MSRPLRLRRRREADAPLTLLSVFMSVLAWSMLVQAGAGNYLHAKYHQTKVCGWESVATPGSSGAWSALGVEVWHGHDHVGCPFCAQVVNRVLPSDRIDVEPQAPLASVVLVSYVEMTGLEAPLKASARAPPFLV